MEQLPERIQLWLQSMEADASSGQGEFEVSDRSDNNSLLQRAALCYAMAQWHADACRVFERAGDFRSAAFYYEQSGDWALAAQCYEQAKEWEKAARCFQRAGEPAQAAECFFAAKQPLQAAWLWAHDAHLFLKAINILDKLETESKTTILRKELILVRCEAGLHTIPAATRRLKKVLLTLWEADNEILFSDLADWVFALTDVLHRPDLRAETHALALQMHWQGAREKWIAWARLTLSDASGIPSGDAVAPYIPSP